MEKLRRVLSVVVGALIAVGAVFLLGVNLYVQSKSTQAKIQQELSHRLGTPVSIRQISVTPWGGLKLSGIVIPYRSPVSPSDFLRAKTFQLRIRLLPLFSRQIVVKEVSLFGPDVVWPQNAEGKWRLPGASAEKGVAPKTEEEPPIPANTPAASETIAATSPAPPVAGETPPSVASQQQPPPDHAPFSISREVQRINVRHGNFSFLDRSGALLGDFQNVDFRSNVRGPGSIRGNAKVAKISLRNRFYLSRLQSPFSYEPDVLELSKISAQAGGGEIEGHFAMQPESEDSPFTVQVTFKDVQADQIVTEAGGPKGMVQGKVEGKFEAAGKTADSNALNGTGEIVLHAGHVRQYSLLVALGQILQIEELTELHLEQAEAKYHVTPGLVTVDQLLLRSPNIRLSATGTIGFNGKLKLESKLAINERIRSQLFKMIRENFQPLDEPGYYALDFNVSGTVERPRTNLMDRMVGRNLKDLVDGFLGGAKPKKKKDKPGKEEKIPDEAASPAPESSSSPAP